MRFEVPLAVPSYSNSAATAHLKPRFEVGSWAQRARMQNRRELFGAKAYYRLHRKSAFDWTPPPRGFAQRLHGEGRTKILIRMRSWAQGCDGCVTLTF